MGPLQEGLFVTYGELRGNLLCACKVSRNKWGAGLDLGAENVLTGAPEGEACESDKPFILFEFERFDGGGDCIF